ncbi:hypothetical protein LCGC14_2653710 [marine sediment metagenome]|uniref:Uncharacterized protein n=1 Tax=marine sediment metagenome TaxID=412755 RepID=A0A0F8ZTX0_9ZZZZ
MDVYYTTTFDKQFKKLRLPSKERNSILEQFNNMNTIQVSQYPYYKHGIFKAFKKYKKGDLRVKFTYCKECYNKYREIFITT